MGKTYSIITVYPSVGNSLCVHEKSIKKVVRGFNVSEIIPDMRPGKITESKA